jgi:4-amino-4-deoxy-L-arabinose transferase-like glycosyltransferase
MLANRHEARNNLSFVRGSALVVLCVFVLLGGLGSRALWDNDEGMHAAMAMEMLRSGDWIVPRFAGEPFVDKPPLFLWLVAGSLALFGSNEFAARLPNALMGTVLILVTYLMGRRAVGDRSAFLGSLALAGSVMFVVLSRAVVHDMALALPVTVALLVFYRRHAVRNGGAWGWMVFWILLGLSVLAKGPLGVVLILGTVGLYLIHQRDLSFLRAMAPLRGSVVALSICVPWFVAMEIREPGFIRFFILSQNFGNFLEVQPRHPEPWWFFVPVLLLGFFPWAHVLATMIVRSLRRPFDLGRGATFLLTWFAFSFLLFSAASSKLPSYLLPAFPALALLAGACGNLFLRGGDRQLRRYWWFSHIGFATIVLGGVPFLWSRLALHPYYDAGRHRVLLVGVLGILVTMVTASTLFLALRRRAAHLASVAVGFASAVVLVSTFLGPALDSRRSTKEIAEWLDRTRPPGEPLVFYYLPKDSAMFYTSRPVRVLPDREAAREFLLSSRTPCTIMNRDLAELEGLQSLYEVLHRRGNKTVIAGKGLG